MANGQLPGKVAPTSIGQGKSYSQMVNEQIGLIQQQRAANLQNRLAQEESNREFRTQQLQNIYDFDVSGLASGDVSLLANLQKQLANSLDPDSPSSYSDSRELVADVAFINNVYNEMKRWGETGISGRSSYQKGILNPDLGDGTVFVGDENTLTSRNDVWEQGAFANAQILGQPGQRQIIGDMLDQDGNIMKQGIDFFENTWRNQPDQFWRPEIAEAAYMDIAGSYADNTNLDLTNVNQKAANDWDHNPVKIQEKYRRDKARREGLSMDDIINDDKTFQDGYTDEELRAEYIAEARRGVSELRKQVQVPGAFAGTVFDTQFGVRAVGLREAMPVNTSTIRGGVTHVGFSGDEMVVVYDDPEGQQNQVKVSETSDVWASILNQAGGLEALKEMIGAENVEKTEVEGEVEGEVVAEESSESEASVEESSEVVAEEQEESVEEVVAESKDEDEDEEDEDEKKKAMMKEMVKKHKGSMKEDVDALFNGESLSEDFRVKATLIFETAVQSRVEKIVEDVLAENDQILSEAIEEIKSELSEQVDEYLNYVVEEWVNENQVAIETGLRAELVGDFIDGLKNLFAEHYIEIPEEKVDVAEELALEVASMQEAAAEKDAAIAALTEEVNVIKKEKAISLACEGLTQVQAEKIKSLAESVEFTTEGDFSNKLAIIRENYFPNKVSVKSEVKAIQETAVEEPEVEPVRDAIMNRYVQALTKTAPKA